MKRVLLFLAVSLFALVLSGCPFFPTNMRVTYSKGSSTSGAAPVDTNLYNYGNTVTILDKGNLENEGCIFLGWKRDGTLYQPGDTFTISYYDDYKFTAAWDDGVGTYFEFELINGGDEAAIKKFNYNYAYNFIIPATYRSKPVTAINNNVFSDKSIYDITFSENLKTIGINAFSNCYIELLTIPDSIESIGATAFRNNRIEKLNIGTSLVSIAAGAFADNILRSVVIPDNIASVGNGAFSGNNITYIEIGADVSIVNNTSFGTYGESFKKSYDDNEKLAGIYIYLDETWERDSN